MNDPLPRTILLVDTERYSDRDDVQQAFLRRMLYDVVDRTLLAAGIDQTLRMRADRGDAIMELIDPGAPLTTLLRALLTEVPAQLRAVNRLAASSAQIRLRAVLATGYVAVDEFDGWVGTDLNHACRLLDGEPLKQALRERTDDYALCVSEPVYAGIVRHNHTGIPADEFTSVTMPSKNGPLGAWMYGPLPKGGPAPEPEGDSGAGTGTGSGSGTVAAPGSASPISGGVFGGVNHGIAGGTFHGDIRLGGGDPR
ncbi:hypothetical protein ACFWIB_26325 [Streptomyces sp. NPDC127051]|uniref:hypothetical protein n=1 Tax=Streptomyces sp. NPDC127051 TaxID=3347119 RepID=UPI00364BE1FB